MNKDDLIFDWSHAEVHRGWKGASVLVAALGFGFVFSVISVQFDHRDIASVKSASVLFLPDHEEGRIWRMKAEEEGPFPGRLEISGLHDPLDELVAGSLKDDSWNPYAITMKSLQMDSVVTAHRISTQGQRVFPRNFKSTETVKEQPKAEVVLSPNLIPYTKESERWLPTTFPPFRMEVEEEVAPAAWRFLLNLRADGTVMECLSLSGGREEGLATITAWVKSLRFQEAEEAERWMGLRLEFLNERSHGPDPK
ncbi:MAG: hypothetical protein V4727_12740 [Verrucomicrobiota bacterium]